MAPEILLHGWPGLLSAYAAVQAPMLAALVRARAPLARLVASPLAAAPLTAATGAGMTLAAPLLHGLGIGATAMTQVIAGASVSIAMGYLAGRALGHRGHSGAVHQRGALVEDLPARARATRAARPPRQRGAQRECITVAGIALTPQDEVKHFKFIGTTGTGKSTAIHEVLETALRRGDRAGIADPDGGYLRRFSRRERAAMMILNPFEHASARWDLVAGDQRCV